MISGQLLGARIFGFSMDDPRVGGLTPTKRKILSHH
jgi:hypothetical protein